MYIYPRSGENFYIRWLAKNGFMVLVWFVS